MYGGSARELPYMALPAAFLTAKSCSGGQFYINNARNLLARCRNLFKNLDIKRKMN